MGGATGEAVTDIIGAGGPPYAGAMVTGCVGCFGTGCAVGCVGTGCVVGCVGTGCVVGCGSGAVFTGAPYAGATDTGGSGCGPGVVASQPAPSATVDTRNAARVMTCTTWLREGARSLVSPQNGQA